MEENNNEIKPDPEKETPTEEETAGDDFAEEMEAMEHDARDDEIIEGLGDSINKQVAMDIEPLLPEKVEETGTAVAEVQEAAAEPEEERKGFIGFLHRIPRWIYILSGIAVFIVSLVIILNVSGLGEKLVIKIGSWFVASKVDYQEVDQNNITYMPELVEDISEFEEKLTPIPTEPPTPIPTATPTPVPEFEKKIVNILLLGEENIGSSSGRGRTDSIMLATIDIEHKKVKLTSFMRDCYVQIPDYQDNRINAAYAFGGVPLLYQTIEKNFNLVPDNYALVRFEDFEKIVDSIGGVDITLSKNEAAYLNRTNYISNPKNRNVKEGLNHMNGNQALGFARVRYVATKNSEKNDFGRITRHREVIEAIIDKVKSLNYFQLFNVAMQCLPFVTTDLMADDIETYLNMVMSVGIENFEIEEYRIPADGTYNFVTIRKMSVLQIDIPKNREILHEFIYGDGTSSKSGE